MSRGVSTGALRSNGAFVRLFLGRVATNAGDSLYAVASMWLVYDLTGSSLYTGVAGALVFGPQALQFLAGPLVDRWPLRRVLVATQLVQAVCVLAVPVAAWVDALSVWVVLGVVPVLTLLNQLVYPAQYAALPRVVDDDRLVRANSLFSLAYQGAEMVFNAVAGVLVGAVGAVALYVVDSASFVVAAALFLGLSIPAAEASSDVGAEGEADADPATASDPDPDGNADAREAADDGSYLATLREGFAYLRGSTLLVMLLGSAVVNLTYGVTLAVLPAFAASLGGAGSYGVLTAAIAGGNLAGAGLASLAEAQPYGRLAIGGYLLAAVCWTGAVFLPGLPTTAALTFAAFVPMGGISVVFWSMLQAAVDESLLGRVSAVASSVSTAAMPVGSLAGGSAATALGTRTVLAGLSVALALLSLYFLVYPDLRTLPAANDADEESLIRASDASEPS